MMMKRLFSSITSSSLPLLNPASAGIAAFTFSRALVRNLSPDFAASALRSDTSAAELSAPIDGELATRQHAAYVSALRALLPAGGVTELPAASGCADSCFVEDTAIVVGGRALLTTPGAPSRRNEVSGVGAALTAAGVRTAVCPPGATLDGGDVLYTGREFFVGLSARTNAAGAAALGAAFPGLRVTPVPLVALAASVERAQAARLAHPTARKQLSAQRAAAAPLHLKSLVSIVGADTLAVADTPLGNEVAHFLQDASGVPRALKRAGAKLQFVLIPAIDAASANAVLVNGTLLIRSGTEHAEGAAELCEFAKGVGLGVVQLDMSELAKADGALTCCSILF
jgi:dimethylargininase